MTQPPAVLFETSMQGVARITLNRPGVRNAQDTRLLYELNEAFDLAAQDDDVTVHRAATAVGPQYDVDSTALECTRWTEPKTSEQVRALWRTP